MPFQMLLKLTVLILILLIWYITLQYCEKNKYLSCYESLKYFPFHLIVSLGYYAILSICYNVLFIKDCKTEHKELLEELKEAKEFFTYNKIKFN